MKKKKPKQFKITEEDFLLANRKASREEEIEMHGKQISMAPTIPFKSKKDYKRNKKVNIDDENI